MSIMEELVTDRNQADVDRCVSLRDKGFAGMTAAERTEWLSGMKGSYNASDLNRVTSAIVYLANLYRQYGYTVTYTPIQIAHADGTTDTTWRMTDIPNEAQLTLFVENLLGFWAAVEEAGMEMVDVWENTGFGYVEPEVPLVAGDYAKLTAAHGVQSLAVTIASDRLSGIRVVGEGWTIAVSEEEIVASYKVPLGRYEDLQDALGALVVLCDAGGGTDYVDATASVRATMRSGAVIDFGIGAIRWSRIINWKAFEGYGYTWAALEAAEMTWAQMERLPAPAGGEGT